MQFPLKNGQLGYMSPALESFLEFSSKDLCYTSKGSNINKRLKTFTPCILRVGIEKNRKQSFLCLLASVYKFYNFFDNDGIKLTSKIEKMIYDDQLLLDLKKKGNTNLNNFSWNKCANETENLYKKLFN